MGVNITTKYFEGPITLSSRIETNLFNKINCLIKNITKRCMYQTFSNMGRNISNINMEFDYILHRQAESNYVLGCVKKNVAEKL